MSDDRAPRTTRLSASAYLRHLRADSARFAAVLAETDPAARVPSCPEWDADDLLWHLAEVQWFWTQVVRDRPAGPPEEHPERPADRAGLQAAFAAWSAELADALAAADPAERAWHWSAEQTVGTSVRRQAHEALVHRLDAEQAAGAVTPLDPDLAADGVAELLDVMYGGEAPDWGRIEGDGDGAPVVRLRLLDAAGGAGVDLFARPCTFLGTHPESGRTFDGPHVLHVGDPGREPEATITGRAGDVDAWLWQRRDDAGIEQAGDPDVLARFRAAVSPPLD